MLIQSCVRTSKKRNTNKIQAIHILSPHKSQQYMTPKYHQSYRSRLKRITLMLFASTLCSYSLLIHQKNSISQFHVSHLQQQYSCLLVGSFFFLSQDVASIISSSHNSPTRKQTLASTRFCSCFPNAPFLSSLFFLFLLVVPQHSYYKLLKDTRSFEVK